MNTINPKGMEVTDWCDRTAGNLAPFVRPMKLLDPNEWQRWATHAVQSLSSKAHVNAPNPLVYDDWRVWADRFNQVIYSL